MTVKEAQNKLIEEFKEIEDWEEKYGLIIKKGKELPPFPEEYRTDKNKVEGCQSRVWMSAKPDGSNMVIFADSDAMIVRGLIAMLLEVYSNKSPADVLAAKPDFVHEIGIDNHLSPTRKNGLGAMLKQIQMYAFAFKALAEKKK